MSISYKGMNKQTIEKIKSLLTMQEVGDPFYIIDDIVDNICACNVYSFSVDNEITPVLFLDKSLAATVAELYNDNKHVTGLTNFYFNVIYTNKKENSLCLLATNKDNQDNLVLEYYTLKEIRETYDLKTTDGLLALS